MLLLYMPTRRRAWWLRMLFYWVVAFWLPIISVAAFGAYVGPEHTLEGFPAILVLIALGGLLHRGARRADRVLSGARALPPGRPIAEQLPFSLLAPPRRNPWLGRALRILGFCLRMIELISPIVALACCSTSVLMSLALVAGLPVHLRLNGRSFFIDEFAQVPVEYWWTSAFMLGSALLLLPMGALGPYVRELGRRLDVRDGRRVLQSPGELPVLLLRSFNDDALQDPRALSLFELRYEERLCAALRPLGPTIALGKPSEAFGYGGAIRLYVSEADWQPVVHHLMRQAAAVVIIMGGSAGLDWEVRTALCRVAPERLLFFFPLVCRSSGWRGLWRFYVGSYLRWRGSRALYDAMHTERTERYRLFRERYASRIPFHLPELGHASFLHFLRGGRPRVLRSRLNLWNFMTWSFLVSPTVRYTRLDIKLTIRSFIEQQFDLDSASMSPHSSDSA